jgi:hypothetical protein|tara:strand:- start:316 stop:525 length:210 start_codon:yes stop_codon:yes gene_type:complete
MNLTEFITKEMKLLIDDENYYGSKQQIESEKFILNESKIEMKYNECLEEYYYRIVEILKSKNLKQYEVK